MKLNVLYKNKIKKFFISEKAYVLLMSFFIGSFIGFVLETLYVSILLGHFTDRGMMHLPFCPIYGFGAVVCIAFLKEPGRGIGHKILYFFKAGLCLIGIEFFTGLVVKYLLHAELWNYEQEHFQLLGIISAKSFLIFGLLGLIYMQWLHPLLEKIVLRIPVKARKIILWILCTGFLIDYIFSLLQLIYKF